MRIHIRRPSAQRFTPVANAVFVAVLALAPFAWPAAAVASDRGGVHLEIEGGDGRHLSLALGGWAADLVRSVLPADLHCGGDSDERVEAVLRFLDRHGDGSRYTLWDDGRAFSGRRHRGRFEIEVGPRPGWHSGAAHIEGPWALAECMLGGRVTIDALLDANATGLDLTVAGGDGRVHLSLR